MDGTPLVDDIRIILRPFIPNEDQALVYSTWQLGLWGSVPRPTNRPTPRFFAIHSRAIAKILESPGTQVQVASPSNNAGLIVGYSVMNKKHLHWVYVKDDYRKHGIGALLTQGFETIAKPQTKIARALAEIKQLRIVE